MGHKNITTTMGYVKIAEDRRRPTPPEVLAAGAGEADPDRRVLLMLGARGNVVAKSGSRDVSAADYYAKLGT